MSSIINKLYYLLGGYTRNFHIARKKLVSKQLKDNKSITANPVNLAVPYLETIINSHKNKDKIVLSAIEFVLTEKCTLSCEYCCNLMPLYDYPETFSLENLKNDFNEFMKIVDYVYEVRLIGGEPFLNPEISALIEYIFSNFSNKFSYISITTNGSLSLDDKTLNVLTKYNDRILVTVSDYGEISTKIIKSLKEYSINMVISGVDWIDFGPASPNNFSKDKLLETYKYCGFRLDCNTLHDGHYHICPRDAHCHKLKLISAPPPLL